MKLPLYTYVFWLVFMVSVEPLMATAQFGDLLIIKGDTSWIDSNPLEAYFEKKGERTIGPVEMKGTCSALWRGYVATWQLENDRLFLVRVQTDYCEDNPTEIDISKEFGSNKVFAQWFSSYIIKPEGALLQYVHMGYMSIYEGETYYSFDAGMLSDAKTTNFLIRDENRLFPGDRFLRDTIKSIILKALPVAERKDFNEKNSCNMFVSFNQAGEIEEIGLSYGEEAETLMEKTLLAKAHSALNNVPKLMEVNHARYHPPRVHIWFDGHCLKYPMDRDYGCDEE